MNFSLPVPAGTSDHGDPNLLCTPPQCSAPGQGWQETVWLSLSVLFLPTKRAPALVVRKDQSEWDAVQASALNAKPGEGIREVMTEPGRDFEVGMSELRARPTRSVDLLVGSDRSVWWPGWIPPAIDRRQKVHGINIVPPDYNVVCVPKDFPLKPRGKKPEIMSQDYWEKKVESIDLLSDYNVPKTLISPVQALWAITTIYRARVDQIVHYGYAAFGLTVVPYELMSITNLLANFARPEYPVMFFVSSPDLVKAENQGGYLDSIAADIDTTSRLPEIEEASNIPAILKEMRVDMGNGITPSRIASALVTLVLAILYILFSFSPLIIVGALSHFKGNNSTSVERGWSLAWLVGATVLPVLDKLVITVVTKRCKRRELYNIILRCILFVPAVGGMVVVGLILKEYGVCTLVG